MSNGRPSTRSPGRTPPFILVGLLLLVCVLAYNYWTLSARNGDLTVKTKKLETEIRTSADAHDTVQKTLEEVQDKLRVSDGNLDQLRQELKERGAELESLRGEISKMQEGESKCKDELIKYEGELESKSQALETMTAEKGVLEKEVATLKAKPKVCDLEQCLQPVQKVVDLFTQVADPQALRKALDGAQIDSNKIMGPAAVKPEVPEVKQVDSENPNQQNNEAPQQPPQPQKQQQPAPNAGENSPEAKKGDQVNSPTVSVDTNTQGASTPASSNNTAGKLVFEPDANITENSEKKTAENSLNNENNSNPSEIVNQRIEESKSEGDNNNIPSKAENVSSTTKASLQTETSTQNSTGDNEKI